MTKLQEIMNLTALEMDIIQFGKIELKNHDEYFESEFDNKRLEKFHFSDLQNKYSYGWYIAKDSLEDQIKEIERFKLFILSHYKED